MYPWFDRKGQLSFLKLTVLVVLFVPGGWTALDYYFGNLGARPLTEAIHQTGLWAIRFLFLSLVVTPARVLLQWPRLILVRRMIGVAAFAYALAHLILYAADQKFDLGKVATEIALRIYLTIGFIALLGLSALAVTSTDRMISRLGSERWQRLHQLAYGIALLGAVHFFLQQKDDVSEPTIMFGLFAWLMGYRLIAYFKGGSLPLWSVAGLSVGCAVLTAFGEAFYFWWKIGAPPTRVLEADLMLTTDIRPAWFVLAAGLVLTLGRLARPAPKRSRARLRPA
ncbi:MAG TPA: protein-methionine-sulfoxide reductase heme-binding subunit MsrQ [Xanthobacteraceae bacterium]|jgi:sulfoxide reductase heme-binding subunit YedZ|nr:protein-methionine-sulfoxide reductase heme-binding subunit MsrQ [Xanthobacteraceae bacterium]